MNATGGRGSAWRAALEAEPDWQALLRHFDYNDGFALVLILVESAENAVLCRMALQEYLRKQEKGSLRLIAVNSPEQAKELPLLLHHPVGLDPSQTLWIESVISEGSVPPESLEEWRSAWRVCFTGLNRIRNTVQRTIPSALVFAVAPWVSQIIHRIAPDFWSIRSLVVRPTPRLAESEMHARETDTFESSRFQRPGTDPALAPDPEFAEREAESLRGIPGKELALARLLQRAGEGYLARGVPAQAIRVLQEARALQEAGSAPLSSLSGTISSLGRAHQMDAQWGKAEDCFRDTLEMDRDYLGEDHATIAVDLSDLAQLLVDTNRLAEAEPLIRRAVAMDERSYGPDHPKVATELNNLAMLLQATNRLAEAEPLMRRALAIDERSYGPDHPDVAIDLNNLARVLQDTNRLAEAEPLMRRALAIDERIFGPDHPKVATRLSNLAGLLLATDRLAEAEPLMRHALAIDERSYGPDHPDVAIDLNNLAQVLQDTNRLAEAEPLMRRALAIEERSYGPDHPKVAIRLNNLAGLLQATNRLAEAERLMRRALDILRNFMNETGHPHPKYDRVRRNYRQMIESLGRQDTEKWD